ncbi:MAG: hypothetical protein ACJATA_002130 [Sphingobacteriales bacterium]|jgi:hypothetical protein
MLNKLNKVFLVFFLLGLSLNLVAQEVQISKTERTLKRLNSHVFGENEEGFFVLKTNAPINYNPFGFITNENKPKILFYDNGMKLKWEKEIQLPTSNSQVVNIFVSQNLIRLFYTSPDNEKENTLLLLKILNTSNGEAAGETKVLDKIPYDKRKIRSFYRINHDRDQKKIVALGFVANEKSGEYSVKVNWFTQSLEPFASQRYNLAVGDGEELVLTDFEVDKDNNVYFLSRKFPENKRRLDFGKYVGYFCTPISNDLISFEFNEPNFQIEELVFGIDNINNRLVVSGFFTETKDYPGSGVFYAYFDPGAQSLSNKTFKKFSAKFLNDFSDINRMNAGRNLINYKVKSLIVRGDGGAVLIAESSFISESSTFNIYSQMYSTSYTYHNNNVIVFSISPNGKIDWEQVVRKRQISENDGGIYNSFSPFLYKDRLVFLYNEAIKRKADVQMAAINFKGLFSEEPVIPAKKDLVIMPAGARQISSAEIVIPCLYKSQPGYVKITF